MVTKPQANAALEKGKLFKHLTLLNLSFVAVPEFLPISNAGLFSEIIFLSVRGQHTIKLLFHLQHEIISLFLCSTKLFCSSFLCPKFLLRFSEKSISKAALNSQYSVGMVILCVTSVPVC
jgi:hypothetical protein